MEKYVGLDVSMEETSVCVVDGGGNIVFEGKHPRERMHCRNLFALRSRIVLETGSLACWLWHELRGRNFPVICLDARHARAALSSASTRPIANDARGLAELPGWAGTAKQTSKA